VWIPELWWIFGQISHYINSNPAIVSLLAIPVSVTIFLAKQWLDNRKSRRELYDRICRFCTTIIKDIIALRNTLNNPKFKKEISPDGKTNFTHIILFSNVYEGLLYSGLFTYFDSELQINLDNMYAKIEYRNELLKERINVLSAVSVTPNDKLKEIYDNYQQLLTESEAELRIELQVMEEKLKEESKKFQ
jgi:hypothetical protein